jgi:hypothetical protein
MCDRDYLEVGALGGESQTNRVCWRQFSDSNIGGSLGSIGERHGTQKNKLMEQRRPEDVAVVQVDNDDTLFVCMCA